MADGIDDLINDENTGPGDIVHRDENKEGQTLETISTRIRTVEQALIKGEVDLNIWEVDRCLVNSWEVGAKGPDKKIVVEPLWQVKVWLKAKNAWNVAEFRQMLLDDMKELAPKYKKVKAKKPQTLLGLLCIFDHHFGKLAWGEEAGDNYDLQIATKRYDAAVDDLLERLQRENPERIAYVVGNDFLHVDQGKSNATTKGTQVTVDGRWQKAFRVGLGAAIRTVEKCRLVAPVDVITVSGNHDEEKLFCLGEALAARFLEADDVDVQNTPSPEYYYRYGKNLLGFVHGDGLNEAKKKQLANKMAVDRPQDWSETSCWEWFLGHLHRERENQWLFRQSDCVQKVVVRECPALCGTDAWHSKNLYMSPLGAELHLYHKETGRYGYYTHTPTE